MAELTDDRDVDREINKLVLDVADQMTSINDTVRRLAEMVQQRGTGPEGPEGPEGPKGPKGDKGDKGDTGPRGRWGARNGDSRGE